MRHTLLALAAAAMLPLSVLGQTSQPNGETSQPNGQSGVGSPFWQATQPTVDYTQRGPDGLPLTLLEQVPRAEYMFGVAKWSYRTAQSELSRLIDRKRDELRTAGGFADATRAEREAWGAYQQARASVLDRLMGDDEYAAAVRLQRQVQRQIEDAHTRGSDPQFIADLAQTKLSYAREISSMERGALEGDQTVDAARRVFLEAGEKLADIHLDVEDQLKADPEIAALRQAVSQMRIEFLALSRYRNSTERVAVRAFEFGLFSRRVDRFRPVYSPFGFYGGNFGYGGFGSFNYGGAIGTGGFRFGSSGQIVDVPLTTFDNGPRFGPLPGRTKMSRDPVPTY
ncbi:MAG: hypothetical protein AAF656_04245 [Planctomycetota bacterium]